MDRLTHSTVRPKHLEQNLNSSDGDTGSNKPTSTSQNKTTPPTLRNVVEINGRIIYPSIQLNEHKNSIIRHDDDSSIVGSCSGSDEEVNDSFQKPTSEITLSSRSTSNHRKNSSTAAQGYFGNYFEYMPEELIRKILFKNIIDFSDLPTTAKNLMKFASVSKFNREFVRRLLTEEGMHEVSFEITKSAIPDFLSKLANEKKEKFTKSRLPDLLALFLNDKKENTTQADVDSLVCEWPYLTIDCSYNKSQYSDRGLEALKKIVAHPELKRLRIINTMPDKIGGLGFEYHKQNDKNLNLIYSMLSREDNDSLKVDVNFRNWLPPQVPLITVIDRSFEPIKKIQSIASNCDNLIFGELNLSRNIEISLYLFHLNQMPWAKQQIKYQNQFVKMMCNVAVSHYAHTISLAGLKFDDEDLAMIINEIKDCNKSNLQHLDLSGNDIDESAAESLSALLQSENTCLKTLLVNNRDISDNAYNILTVALKNNHSLELVDIRNAFPIVANHPITNDKRVKLTQNP